MVDNQTSGHRCHVYADSRSEARELTAFLDEGLRAGAQCRVVAYTEAPDLAIGSLAAGGLNLADVLLREALDVVPARGTPLLAMPFDPQAAVDWVRGLAERAQAQSFPALWLAIEMRWALASAVGEAGLGRFERGLDALTRQLPIVALCQYDAGAFPTEWLQRALRAHGQSDRMMPPTE